MKRFLTVLLIAAFLGTAGWAAYRAWVARRDTNSAAAKWQIIPVERGPIEATVNATGVIQPKRQGVMAFRTAGRIEKIYVQEGQAVRQGDLLARLETKEITPQVRQAEIALRIAEERAKLARRKASSEDLAAAEAALRSAQENLARLKRGPSERQLAAAEASMKAAEAAYKKLTAGPTADDLRRAKLAVDQAKNSLWGAQNARDSLGLSAQLGGPRSQYDQAQAQVLNAEIAVELAEINYREMKKGAGEAELEAARAKLEQAREAYETLKDSPRPNEVAAAEAQVAQAEATLARLRAGASEEEIAIAEAQVEQARLSLEQAQQLLENAIMTAPFDGLIAAVNVEEGDSVNAITPVISLLDTSAFRIQVYIDEVDIASVQEGQPVILTLDALPDREIRGLVASIAPLASTDGSVISYKVVVDIAPTEAPLKVGMSANAEITTLRKDNVLLAPNRAIFVDRENGTYHVEKWVDGKIVDVEIVPGMRNDFVSEVLEGVAQGDNLVIRTQSLTEQLRETFGRRPGSQ